MGGTPHHALLNIALRKHTPAEFFQFLLKGVKDALKLYSGVLVGGDLSTARGGISLSATLIGSARKYLRRSGAHVGDRIYVTGNLGDSACGLRVLKKIQRTIPISMKKSQSGTHSFGKQFGTVRERSVRSGLSWKTVEPLLRRHLLPEARNPHEVTRYAHSMIDISDGLLIDLTRLCNESGTGARIYEEKIPVSVEMEKTARYLGLNPLTLALSGGEDYELLFTAPKRNRISATHIGEITESERVIVSEKGKERVFSGEGYQHFR
jgi:thiamine-monophosphate kinase